jgi:hypothetical protein
LGRGSIAFADRIGSNITFTNCLINNNYAINGGVVFAHYSSQAVFNNCNFSNNFGLYGGVAYSNDGGII